MAADHFDQLEEAVERFCSRLQPAADAGSDQAGELLRLRKLCDRLEVEFCKRAGTFAQTGDAELRGSRSPIGWIRHNCHMSGNAAADRIRVGTELHRLPASQQAVASGQIGFSHLSLIAQTARALVRSPTNPCVDEHVLLDSARTLTVSRFRHYCHQVRHIDDQSGLAVQTFEVDESNRFAITTRENGRVTVNGTFDTAAGTVVRSALEPLARRANPDDPRPLERRLAEAFVDLCFRAVDAGAAAEMPAGSAQPALDTHSGRCSWPNGTRHLVRTADGRLVAVPPPNPGPRPPTPGPGQPRAA